MAIDFPSSPTTGQTYTFGNVGYQYDGEKWVVTGAGPSLPLSIANGGTGSATGVNAVSLDTAIPAFGYDPSINLGLAASAASSALTITLTGADGNTPSATNPVIIPFRNVTATTGTPTILEVTAATTLVVSSGSTLGVTSTTAFRLWVVGFNDAGTFRLGVVNATTCTTTACTIYPLTDWAVKSATSEGGAGAADSAQTIYSNATVTSKAMRVLGFLEWSSTGLTAGTWTTTNLNRIQIFGPGVHLPGHVVQQVNSQSTNVAATSTSTTFASTTDTIAITNPTSAANPLHIVVYGTMQQGAVNGECDVQLSRGITGNTNMIGALLSCFTSGGNMEIPVTVEAWDLPNTTSSQTYAVQFRRGSTSVTVTWSPTPTTVMKTIQEVMG